MLSRIHVDQHTIRRNRAQGTNDPPLTVKTYKGNIKCYDIEICGPSRVVYSPDKPLSCGARLWVETQAEVITR